MDNRANYEMTEFEAKVVKAIKKGANTCKEVANKLNVSVYRVNGAISTLNFKDYIDINMGTSLRQRLLSVR